MSGRSFGHTHTCVYLCACVIDFSVLLLSAYQGTASHYDYQIITLILLCFILFLALMILENVCIQFSLTCSQIDKLIPAMGKKYTQCNNLFEAIFFVKKFPLM